MNCADPALVIATARRWLGTPYRSATTDGFALLVEYSTTDQARAAEEVEALPEGAVVVAMLSDYAVLRDQARACQ